MERLRGNVQYSSLSVSCTVPGVGSLWGAAAVQNLRGVSQEHTVRL